MVVALTTTTTATRGVTRFLDSGRAVFNARVVITPKACIERRSCELLGGRGYALPEIFSFTETSKTPFHAFFRLEKCLSSQDIYPELYHNFEPKHQNGRFIYHK